MVSLAKVGLPFVHFGHVLNFRLCARLLIFLLCACHEQNSDLKLFREVVPSLLLPSLLFLPLSLSSSIPFPLLPVFCSRLVWFFFSPRKIEPCHTTTLRSTRALRVQQKKNRYKAKQNRTKKEEIRKKEEACGRSKMLAG